MATLHPEDYPTLDIREQIARIDKMQAELQKISVEILQVRQTTMLEPWRIILGGVAAGVALFGAAAAFVKLII